MGKRIIVMALCMLAVGLPVFGGGYPETYGAGARAICLGGAFTAVADDYSATYYNPAGLAQGVGHQVAVDYLYTRPDITVKTSRGDLKIYDMNSEVRNDPTEAGAGHGLELHIPQVGAVLDLNRVTPKLPIHARLGVLVSMPEQFDVGLRLNDYPPDQPHLLRYGDDIDHITMIVGLGIEALKDLLYLGGGVQVAVTGPGTFYIDRLRLGSEDVVSQSEFGTTMEYKPMAGILITPLEKRLKFGFSWRQEQELSLGPIPVVATATIGGIAMEVPMRLDIKCFFTPEEYSAGIAYDGENLLVALEVNKQLWSKYEYSGTDKYHYYPGAPSLVGVATSDPDFDDTINYRIGVEYKLNKAMSILAGYCRQPSPVPNQSGRVNNYLDMDKDTVSLGASYTFKDPTGIVKPPIKVAGMLLYQRLEDLSVNKDGVKGFSWVNQESYKVEGQTMGAGLSASLAW